ncbi:Probable ABC transporter permease protein HI_1471 [Serratia fonticola]|uniref:Probable ABC transporter permease protein HI_1471 n=1 Tax=Serratia fonticola TaxID=47917 RepID=A0A4U9W0M6_SERFO|nr:Probable ABC transporter permease protein HI_1471 [Serratia fonticola]
MILGVRVPRVLLAMGAGSALALCGAALQGVFRNPFGRSTYYWSFLLEPLLAAPLAILLALPVLMLLLSAFVFGMLALLLIFAHHQRRCPEEYSFFGAGRGDPQRLLFCLRPALVQYLADSEEKLPSIVFWAARPALPRRIAISC